MRFLGTEEIVSDDQLEGNEIYSINKQMCVSPPLETGVIVRSQSRSKAPINRDGVTLPHASEISMRTSPIKSLPTVQQTEGKYQHSKSLRERGLNDPARLRRKKSAKTGYYP